MDGGQKKGNLLGRQYEGVSSGLFGGGGVVGNSKLNSPTTTNAPSTKEVENWSSRQHIYTVQTAAKPLKALQRIKKRSYIRNEFLKHDRQLFGVIVQLCKAAHFVQCAHIPFQCGCMDESSLLWKYIGLDFFKHESPIQYEIFPWTQIVLSPLCM